MDTLMNSVEDDEEWIKAAPQGVFNDSELLRRASLALQHPLTAFQNEDYQLALKNLLQFGLVAEMSLVPGTSSELSHFIASLLNFSINNRPCLHSFQLQIGGRPYSIPERSKFFFLRLSVVLRSNIFIFSSRAKPLLFSPKNATRTLALFHGINSYSSISHFIVLAASSHVPCITENQPEEPSQYTNPISPATFRLETRKYQTRSREDDSCLTKSVCKRAFSKAL